MTSTHKSISRLAANIRNIETRGFGRNGEASCGAARTNYRAAVEFVVRMEDEHGVEAATPVALKVEDLMRCAIEVGLMSRIEADKQEQLAVAAVNEPVAGPENPNDFTPVAEARERAEFLRRAS